jgi:hypothetical protein
MRRWLRWHEGEIILGVFVVVMTLWFFPAHARGGDAGRWGWVDPETRKWFAEVTIPGNGKQSCCGLGDAVQVEILSSTENEFLVRVVDGQGVVVDGTEISVPRGKLQTAYGNPIGVLILFVGTGDEGEINPLCLIPLPGT